MKKEIDYAHQWLKIPTEQKTKLAEVFKIDKTSPVRVINNEVVEDGYSSQELRKLSVASMIEFLGEGLEFYREDLFDYLFEITFNKIIHGKDTPKEQQQEQQRQENKEKAAKAKRGRPKKETSTVQGSA